MADAAMPPLERSSTHWRLLFRAIGIASDPRSLILAAVGLVMMQTGWSLLTSILAQPDWTSLVAPNLFPGSGLLQDERFRPVYSIVRPFFLFFRPDVSAGERFYFSVCALWSLFVWSLIGGAIVRIAVVRVATRGRVSLISALKFSARRLGTLITAPLVPLGVACLIALAGASVGLFGRVIPVVTTLFAFVPLIVGLLNAVILLGLLAAWPLMVATVAADGEDFFDAVSRSYSYVNQQTARYLGYLALGVVIGGLGMVAVNLFASTALQLADWSTSLGAPKNVGFRFGDLNDLSHMKGISRAFVQDPALMGGVDSPALPDIGQLWKSLIEAILNGWTTSYFWSFAAILYLILRRDVDGKEIHEIYEPKPVVAEVVSKETSANPLE